MFNIDCNTQQHEIKRDCGDMIAVLFIFERSCNLLCATSLLHRYFALELLFLPLFCRYLFYRADHAAINRVPP